MPSRTPHAAVAGLGLIGGSLGMALRRKGWKVSYLDPNVRAQDALAAGAADARLESLTRAGADLIVLATPVDAALALLPEAEAAGAAVTSVCSVMVPLTLSARSSRFVAGHPLAGSEKRSLSAATADLFQGRPWFLDAGTREAVVDRMVSDTGAAIDRVSPEEHDRAVALTSHLPQLLSTALASALGASGTDLDRFGGSGLRTLLRLAGSSEEVWAPTITANHEAIANAWRETAHAAERILAGEGTADFEKAIAVWTKLADSKD